MSSSPSSQTTVTYTLIPSFNDRPSFGIPLVDVYESEPGAPEAAPQSPDQAPLLPVHAPVYPEYLAPCDDDLDPAEAQPLPASDPKEDPFEEEEHLAPAASALALLDSISPSEETEPFEKDETAPTPPSPASPQQIIPIS
ncbi:hypothetical protein Tco_0816117 [Tanacetum coccineum]